MILVKLGGSVITDKTRLKAFKKESVTRLAREIFRAGKKVIVVHGAGSFGHFVAHKYKLQHGYVGEEQLAGFSKVMCDVRELNLKVMRVMEREGLNPASIPPSACAMLDGGRLVRLDLDSFERYASMGATPVTFGDVCLDRSRRFGICSGDQLMERLAEHFSPEKVVFCADVDGIFSSDPAADPRARLLREVDRSMLEGLPRGMRYVDVTGSIFGKIECMLRMASHSGECLVINGNAPGRLESALRGRSVRGSRIVGG